MGSFSSSSLFLLFFFFSSSHSKVRTTPFFSSSLINDSQGSFLLPFSKCVFTVFIYLFIFIPRCFEKPVLEFSPSDVSSGSPLLKEVFFFFYNSRNRLFFFRYGSGVRHREERHRGCVDGSRRSWIDFVLGIRHREERRRGCVDGRDEVVAGLILCLVSCTFLAVRLLQFSPFPFINSFIEYVCTIVNNTKQWH